MSVHFIITDYTSHICNCKVMFNLKEASAYNTEMKVADTVIL